MSQQFACETDARIRQGIKKIDFQVLSLKEVFEHSAQNDEAGEERLKVVLKVLCIAPGEFDLIVFCVTGLVFQSCRSGTGSGSEPNHGFRVILISGFEQDGLYQFCGSPTLPSSIRPMISVQIIRGQYARHRYLNSCGVGCA